MKQQIFPVHALNANITRILSRITTVNIHECISNGLSNEIFLIDENSRITCPAEIIYNKLEDKSIVKLSSAYCLYSCGHKNKQGVCIKEVFHNTNTFIHYFRLFTP